MDGTKSFRMRLILPDKFGTFDIEQDFFDTFHAYRRLRRAVSNVVRDVHRGKLLTFPVDLGEERYGEDYPSG